MSWARYREGGCDIGVITPSNTDNGQGHVSKHVKINPEQGAPLQCHVYHSWSGPTCNINNQNPKNEEMWCNKGLLGQFHVHML